jgi:protease IV
MSTPNSIRLSSQKAFAVFILSFYLFINLSGCTFLNVNLTPSVSDLKEKEVFGVGSNKILLIDIQGTISNGSSRSPLGFLVETGMPARIREVLEKAEDDKDIKALILRINSPGGTVTASDIIYHELQEFKKRNQIKVYAVIMDLAASGGYYIAMAADKIIAHPTSITGSIGVIALKPIINGLMDKLGVGVDVVKSVDKKDFMAPWRPFTVEERRLFQETIDGFHQRFIEIIAENRPELTIDQIKQFADGRIFDSQKSIDNKLIDEVGYLDDSIDSIQRDLDLESISVVTYFRPGNYKNNIYSALNKPTNISLFNMRLSPSLNFNPVFLYLWTP